MSKMRVAAGYCGQPGSPSRAKATHAVRIRAARARVSSVSGTASAPVSTRPTTSKTNGSSIAWLAPRRPSWPGERQSKRYRQVEPVCASARRRVGTPNIQSVPTASATSAGVVPRPADR